MYQILDYKKRAINMLIPYLLEFPQLISIVEQGADRYQEIEKVIWELATNLRLDDSRGIWLDAKTKNTATNIIYTDIAKDAFTYGTDQPELQGYGAGHYYSQANYISGTNLTISEQKQIRGIKSKIIRNNFDGTIESFIKAIQLLFNAEQVIISESYPLAVSVMMKGSSMEVSSSAMYEQIKALLAGGVKLNNIFLDNNTFNVFKYDGKQAFGDTRYPVLITDTLDLITFKGKCIKFTSDNKMYCKSNVYLDANKLFVTCGRLYKDIDTYSTIISCNDKVNSMSLYIDSENKLNLTIGDTTSTFDTPLVVNNDYTIIYYQNKVWLINGCKLTGDYDADISYLSGLINYYEPNISINTDVNNINSSIYFNGLITNEGKINDLSYGDFIYYNMIMGDVINKQMSIPYYYITAYGETKILFNVIDNNNHLKINMSKRLNENLYEPQSSFKYELMHHDKRQMMLETGDSIVYNTVGGGNKHIELSFDLYIPFSNPDEEQQILKLYKGDNTTDLLKVSLLNDKLEISLTYHVLNAEGQEETVTSKDSLDITTQKYHQINISIDNNNTYLDVNNKQSHLVYLVDILHDIGNTVTLGNTYNGIISNFSLRTDLYQLELPFDTTINHGVYSHTNNGGAKFITVPSSISNTANIIIN